MNSFEIFITAFIFFHALLMLIDEFYFHRKRGLPKWERIGHPIDTFFVLICFAIIIFLPCTKNNILTYSFFSTVSCLIIVKDERIHLNFCEKNEQYLHALLFIFHPIFLILIFLGWSSFSPSAFDFMNYFSSIFLKYIFLFQFISIITFFIYQILYWNFFRKGVMHVCKSKS